MKNNRFSHGGELKNKDNKIKYDFSVNINPLGLPKSVKQALSQSASIFTDYPDPDCRLLRNALAEKEEIRPEQIVCGNGASDIIYRICEALAIKRALIPAPAFSEYERALALNSAAIEHIYTEPDDGFALTAASFEKWIKERRSKVSTGKSRGNTMLPDAIFLCNPTNPSGRLLDKALIEKAAQWCAENSATLIIDECFLEFHEDRNKLTAINMLIENSGIRIIVINAFTKIYSMAGLRLGYAICSDAETARMIASHGPHWNVSGPAQAAGIVALRESDYLKKSVKYIKKERERLSNALSDALTGKDSAFRVFKSDANYILFTAPPGLAEAMAAEGVAIRDCGNYAGLSVSERNEYYYRVAVRTEKEDDAMIEALIKALRRCMKWL